MSSTLRRFFSGERLEARETKTYSRNGDSKSSEDAKEITAMDLTDSLTLGFAPVFQKEKVNLSNLLPKNGVACSGWWKMFISSTIRSHPNPLKKIYTNKSSKSKLWIPFCWKVASTRSISTTTWEFFCNPAATSWLAKWWLPLHDFYVWIRNTIWFWCFVKSGRCG